MICISSQWKTTVRRVPCDAFALIMMAHHHDRSMQALRLPVARAFEKARAQKPVFNTEN
jgi:hypothetical protein